MIIIFVLILWIIGLSIALALYSSFLPYFSLLRDIKDYNMAYYGANTAIERSLLVLRQQEAWFEWTGWWIRSMSADVQSDVSYNQDFGYFDNKTDLMWRIQSRSQDGVLPIWWKWNSKVYNLTTWSNDYNVLSYGRTQTIPLWYDGTPQKNAYQKDSIESRVNLSMNNIRLHLKLPSAIVQTFMDQWWVSSTDVLLCDNWGECDVDGDGIANDVLVSWWLNGWFDYLWEVYNVSILPRNLIGRLTWDAELVVFGEDESIRESDINMITEWSSESIDFSSNINPLLQFRWSELTWHLMIWSSLLFDEVWLHQYLFSELFSVISSPYFQISLWKKLISRNNNFYPYLEYKLESDSALTQPFFYIDWTSRVWNYTVQMNAKKSLDQENSLSSFTVVF